MFKNNRKVGIQNNRASRKGKIHLRFENYEVIVLVHFLVTGVKGFQ